MTDVVSDSQPLPAALENGPDEPKKPLVLDFAAKGADESPDWDARVKVSDVHLAGIHNKNISAYDIAEVSFEVDSTNYVTDEAHLPADSKVVGNTWLNVNSDGSPDRRYKHNMPCLICEFGKLRISSDTGLDVLFLLSNADNVEQFKSILPQ